VLGVLALAYVGVCVACFLLVESCGDSQFDWYRYLVLVGGAIALAIALIAGFGKEGRSSWIWVPIVVASPFVGLVIAFFAGLQGEFSGQCGRY